MQKVIKNKSFVFISLILICLLFSSFFILGDTNKIHGVIPTKVTAHALKSNVVAASGKILGTYTAFLEFWNVGNYGDGEQTDVKCHIVYNGERYYENSEEVWVEDGDSYDHDWYSFSGGPNGTFADLCGSSTIYWHIEDRNKIVYDPYQSGCSTLEPYTIDNPGAFDGWTEDAEDESIYTKPTIELFILDGPVSVGNGKVSYTIKAQVTGNPEPEVEFTGVSQGRVISTDTPNVVKIDLNPDETLELTATATNDSGSTTASISLVGSSLAAPTITLLIKGPVADEDGTSYSFIIEAKVSGNPVPEISFNRNDSDGSMGTNKAIITLVSGSEFIVTATAANSQGSASASATLSTLNDAPKLDLKIIEGPVWVNIESEYYIIEAVVKGFPVPDVVWECPGRFIFWPAGKNKKKVYVKEEGDFARAFVTAYAENSTGKTKKQEIWVEWVAPPKDMFTERTFTIMENYKISGKLFVKRAGEHNWVEVSQTTTLYDGDDIKTDNTGAAIIASDLKGHLVLSQNAYFSFAKGEDGKAIIICQGNASFKIISAKDNSIDNFIIKSKFADAKPTGTDFIINTDENQSVLKVIDGTVEFTSTVSDESIIVNPGESVIATEKGLGEKTNFDIASEEKYWNTIEEKLGFVDNSQNSGSFISNIQNSLNEGKVPRSLIIILVTEALLLFAVLAFLIIVIAKTKSR